MKSNGRSACRTECHSVPQPGRSPRAQRSIPRARKAYRSGRPKDLRRKCRLFKKGKMWTLGNYSGIGVRASSSKSSPPTIVVIPRISVSDCSFRSITTVPSATRP
jgi:hypothetical protein